MKKEKITSATLHTTADGQRISYTYAVEDTETGEVVSDNKRDSIGLTAGIADMDAVQEHIDAVFAFVREKRKKKREAEFEAMKAMMEEN